MYYLHTSDPELPIRDDKDDDKSMEAKLEQFKADTEAANNEYNKSRNAIIVIAGFIFLAAILRTFYH